MENMGDEEYERHRSSGVRTPPSNSSPLIQIDMEHEGVKSNIRKIQREENRRKRNKTNGEGRGGEESTGRTSENEIMESEQVANIRETKEMVIAIIKCIDLAYTESSKKAPPMFDKAELYNFVELLEQKIIVQMEKNLMLAEQNICLAEQALYLNNNKEEHKEYEQGGETKKLYSEILIKQTTARYQNGAILSRPTVPSSARHSPSECVIIIKGSRNGRLLTERELKKSKEKICRKIGNAFVSEVLVIRSTRSGGYIIVLKSSEKREEIKEKLESDEFPKEKIVLPKAKLPKVICKNVTEDFSSEELERDLYSWKNPKMQNIPPQERRAKVIQTRLGVVIEMFSPEIMAIELQDWRIRYGYGNEMRVEEFIPIQQCYNCSCFGHSADNCENMPRCRLCASSEHSGRNCNKRNDKTKWKCINCLDSNLRRNTKLDVNHGAAQLHKCQLAINEKEIKKQQLVNEGIYVSHSNELGIRSDIPLNNRSRNFHVHNRETRTDLVSNNVFPGKEIMEKKSSNTRGAETRHTNANRKTLQKENLLSESNDDVNIDEEKNINISESELEIEKQATEVTNQSRGIRNIESQRRGFSGTTIKENETEVDGNQEGVRGGRSRNGGRQRSASRIRNRGTVAPAGHHTRSTSSVGEVLLAYSPVKRKDVIRRGRPTKSSDVVNKEEENNETRGKRLTPRSEGQRVRMDRIGGYVDRSRGGSLRDSDEAMSEGVLLTTVSKDKDRNIR